MFRKWKKKRFEKGLDKLGFGKIDAEKMICEKCKETLEKSEEDVRQGRIKKFDNADDMIKELIN